MIIVHRGYKDQSDRFRGNPFWAFTTPELQGAVNGVAAAGHTQKITTCGRVKFPGTVAFVALKVFCASEQGDSAEVLRVGAGMPFCAVSDRGRSEMSVSSQNMDALQPAVGK